MSTNGIFEVFGYLPDPPKKAGEKPDFDFTTKLLPKLKVVSTGDVDLSAHTSSTNQYSASSCAGNATADSVEVLNSIAGLPKIQLSRLFIYTLARNLMDMDGDGRSDIDKDAGTYIRLCFDILARFGICREDLGSKEGGWPYDLDKIATLPSLKAMRAATAHRIHGYYKIYEDGDYRLEFILEALRAYHPVVFGTSVTRAFTQLRGEGPVGPPEGQTTIGGHAMMIVGFDSQKGFLIKNSWGDFWGNGGFCYMTPEYIAWSGTSDIWVPTKGTEF
jgi:hypothetical protein